MGTQSLSHVQLFVIPWTAVHQARLSREFSKQEHCGLPFPTPEDLVNPGIKHASLASPALAVRCFTTVPPRKTSYIYGQLIYDKKAKNIKHRKTVLFNEKTKQPHAKKQTNKKKPDKTRLLSHTKHKNQLKTD